MNIVDSSGWLEYFANTKRAKYFAKIIENQKSLIIPTIIMYEVFKKILLETDKRKAHEALAHMKQGNIVELNEKITLLAASLSIQHKLAMADSIILATAQAHNATIWTQDADFKKIPGVKYFAKK